MPRTARSRPKTARSCRPISLLRRMGCTPRPWSTSSATTGSSRLGTRVGRVCGGWCRGTSSSRIRRRRTWFKTRPRGTSRQPGAPLVWCGIRAESASCRVPFLIITSSLHTDVWATCADCFGETLATNSRTSFTSRGNSTPPTLEKVRDEPVPVVQTDELYWLLMPSVI